MAEFRVRRRGFEKRWVIVKTVPGAEPVEVGVPYDDPEPAMREATRLNEDARLIAKGTQSGPE
jgi:hypothetical protein